MVVDEKEYNKLKNAYDMLQKQYEALLKQDKSLQQYPKLFNDHIFDRLTPEEVIEAAKKYILQNSKGDNYEKV